MRWSLDDARNHFLARAGSEDEGAARTMYHERRAVAGERLHQKTLLRWQRSRKDTKIPEQYAVTSWSCPAQTRWPGLLSYIVRRFPRAACVQGCSSRAEQRWETLPPRGFFRKALHGGDGIGNLIRFLREGVSNALAHIGVVNLGRAIIPFLWPGICNLFLTRAGCRLVAWVCATPQRTPHLYVAPLTARDAVGIRSLCAILAIGHPAFTQRRRDELNRLTNAHRVCL